MPENGNLRSAAGDRNSENLVLTFAWKYVKIPLRLQESKRLTAPIGGVQ